MNYYELINKKVMYKGSEFLIIGAKMGKKYLAIEIADKKENLWTVKIVPRVFDNFFTIIKDTPVNKEKTNELKEKLHNIKTNNREVSKKNKEQKSNKLFDLINRDCPGCTRQDIICNYVAVVRVKNRGPKKYIIKEITETGIRAPYSSTNNPDEDYLINLIQGAMGKKQKRSDTFFINANCIIKFEKKNGVTK